MATDVGLSPEILETEAFSPGKVLEKSGSLSSGLLERLRSRCGQHKSWSDSMKAMRVVMNDKRFQGDALEKSSLQNCLDKLHRVMKITSQQSLIERLDLISRQLGMMFTPPTHLDNKVILSSEMFKVVVVLEGQSGIRDVCVCHQDNPTSCEDMVEVLSKGNFEEFVRHLQGLLSIYSIQGDRKQKNKGYLALSSLESDLNQLAQLQSSINGVANYIHKSPLGILLPRRGGHPMKLIYYVSPYDLLCKKTMSSHAMTVEAITDNHLGHSVTVSLEPSPYINKLQTIPLMSVRTNQDGRSLHTFQNVNNVNSCSLSANFTLVLPHAIPVTSSLITSIKEITGLDVICEKEESFLSLLLQHCSKGSVVNNDELFVTLPDQQHIYFFNKNSEGCLGQAGALVTKIPFTHPTCVPKVLNLLRQQLMFNSVLCSLVRPQAKKEYQSGVVFELTAVSLTYISVMFEHPLQHSMLTVELDISDLTSVQCHVCMNNKDESICSDEYVSRAFQRSFSIPITLRSVIKKVDEQIRQLVPPEPVKQIVVKSRLTWTQSNSVKKLTTVTTTSSSAVTAVPTQNTLTNLPNPPPYPGAEGWSPNQIVEMHKYTIHLNKTLTETTPVPEESLEPKPGANPLLATLLDARSPAMEREPPQQTPPAPPQPQAVPQVNESPMLSKLLEENTSVASNPFPAPNPRKRLAKRKSSKDIIAGKSPKHRISESDINIADWASNDRISSERHGQGMAEKHIDLDSSGGSYEELARPSSVNSVGSVGGQSTGSVIDLTDIGESHVKKLENSLDSIMGKESPRSSMNMGYPLNSQMSGLDMMDMNLSDFPPNPNQILGDGGGDFHPPPQWPSRQTPPTPTSRNSPHHGVVPKNEKTSTSLEELLLGPGGRENDGPVPAQVRRNSQQRRNSLKRQNSLSRNSMDSTAGVTSPDVFSPLMTSPSHHPLSSPGQFPISSPNYIVSPGILPQMSPSHVSTLTSPSFQTVSVKSEPCDSKAGILASCQNAVRMSSLHNVQVSSGGKSISMLKAQLDMKNDLKNNACAISGDRDGLKEDSSNSSTGSQPPSLKLKLSNMRQYDSVSPADSDGSKRSSTFDFHSDDEDFVLPMVEKMTVVSASPTRLQITNKSTLASFNKFNKSEKFKRKQREKELKSVLSVDSGKRKRDKEESKKERKKKKLNNSYSVEKETAVYKSTTVNVDVGNENEHYKPMPKLKITKEGVKMSIENSVLHVKEVKVVDKLEKTEKEAVVKIEKLEKSIKKEILEKEIKVKEKIEKSKKDNKVSEKTKISGSGSTLSKGISASDEGIFDKINAMKTENLSKGESESSDKSSPHENKKTSSSSTSSSKSNKSHKTQRSSSSSSKSSDSKISRTPTIKLKPIVVPSSNSSGVTVSRTPSTPTTPSTPKSITQSPTSTTIGKIGAVSLATSGSQKQLTQNSNGKSPQGPIAAGKSSTQSSKSSSGSTSSKSSGSNLQKNIQIQGPSGKNSPNPQSNKSGHARSSSTSALILSSTKSEKSLNKSLSSASSRTSSPHSEKEKSKSSSRGSSSSGRDKSTSSSKTSVPTSTVMTAASVLSFLNPKANKIASLPPIPKLSSTSSGQKVPTPTSVNNPIVTTTSATTSCTSTTSTVNSKFSKAGGQVTSTSKSNSSTSNVNSGKSNMYVSNSGGSKNSYSHSKGNSGSGSNSSNNRPTNQQVSNVSNSNRNSPQSYSNKGGNSYNKGSSHNSVNNSNSNYRNNYNSGGSSSNRNSNTHNSGNSNWGNNSNVNSNPHGGSKSNSSSSNVSNQQSGSRANKGGSSSDSAGNRNSSVNNSVSNFRGSSTVPNAPKGPGPPVSKQSSVDKNKHSVNNTAARGRKGSLSAVIDKLTCKATVPVTNSSTSQKVDQVVVNESPASPEMESSVPTVTEEKKVVIFEAPASPEPDSSITTVSKGDQIRTSSEIVSIPLENEPEQPTNTSDYSRESSSNKLTNSDKKRDSSISISKSSITLNSSPKIIPLHSPKDKVSVTKSTTAASSYKKALSEPSSVEIVNSVDKQNGEAEEYNDKHDTGSTEINSHISSSDLAVNDTKAKDNVFKIPTQKLNENSDKHSEDIENLGGRRKFHSGSLNKSMSDSNSPVSSPENGLIIDCPSSPRHLQNKTNSPQCNPVLDNFTESKTSSNFLKSTNIKAKLKTSPSCSPTRKDSSGLGSNANSPDVFEDDLMDEALGFGN